MPNATVGKPKKERKHTPDNHTALYCSLRAIHSVYGKRTDSGALIFSRFRIQLNMIRKWRTQQLSRDQHRSDRRLHELDADGHNAHCRADVARIRVTGTFGCRRFSEPTKTPIEDFRISTPRLRSPMRRAFAVLSGRSTVSANSFLVLKIRDL
jgi:hypothetical protein